MERIPGNVTINRKKTYFIRGVHAVAPRLSRKIATFVTSNLQSVSTGRSLSYGSAFPDPSAGSPRTTTTPSTTVWNKFNDFTYRDFLYGGIATEIASRTKSLPAIFR
jgi:hypothetical protein